MTFSILIVDDDDDLRKSLAHLLEGLPNVLIQMAANGREALDIISSARIDLVITDIQMPIMNGAELLQAVQQLSATKPKVVVMSGYSPYSPETLVKMGAHAFFEKPGISALLNMAKKMATTAA